MFLSYGQELGPVQGVGYVNELIARLTDSPVHDSTQTNRTLDSNATTFPLNRTFYADFSHDNEMIAIYSAIGLFRPPQPLKTNSTSFFVTRTTTPDTLKTATTTATSPNQSPLVLLPTTSGWTAALLRERDCVMML